jgi:hypothetical protein
VRACSPSQSSSSRHSGPRDTFDRVKALGAEHPEWKDRQPFKAVLEGDARALAAAGEKGIVELVTVTHSGMTTEAFAKIVADWLARSGGHAERMFLLPNPFYWSSTDSCAAGGDRRLSRDALSHNAGALVRHALLLSRMRPFWAVLTAHGLPRRGPTLMDDWRRRRA